jgi:hypothetical protein
VNLDLARTVADVVLFEGYLLYPYRASSDKNRVRWQFGVLGPPGAAESGTGEEPGMSVQCLLTSPDRPAEARLVVHVRFLQLQHRQVVDRHGGPVDEVTAGDTTWITWDEAVEREVTTTVPWPTSGNPFHRSIEIPGGAERETLADGDGAELGAVVRRRWQLSGKLTVSGTPLDALTMIEVNLDNAAPGRTTDKDAAIQTSFIGAHLLVEAHGAEFVSLLDPPTEAREAAGACSQRRCWPVLTGAPGDTDLLLCSPIILYDYPQVAVESAGALFDATEIDEILTLRVMTMTDAEKAEARATDPRAREIVDRCDELPPEALQLMHGILRNPHAEEASLLAGPSPAGIPDVRDLDPPTFETGDVPWWDPEADADVQPAVDSVTIDGVEVSRGSLVRVHPSRRADAQDLFFADQVARVTAVLSDVDGAAHVALVLVDDPAADLHDWYGRYFYFAPDEVSPLSEGEARLVEASEDRAGDREESRP